MPNSIDQMVIRPLLWRYGDLPHVTRLSLRTIARLRASKLLPEPDVRFGRALAWKPETIERWLETLGTQDQQSA